MPVPSNQCKVLCHLVVVFFSSTIICNVRAQPTFCGQCSDTIELLILQQLHLLFPYNHQFQMYQNQHHCHSPCLPKATNVRLFSATGFNIWPFQQSQSFIWSMLPNPSVATIPSSFTNYAAIRPSQVVEAGKRIRSHRYYSRWIGNEPNQH